MVPVEIKNGNPPDAPSFHEVFLRSGLVAQANVQKTNFIDSGGEWSYQSLDNLSDGQDYQVDGFGIKATMDYTNSTIVADNEDTSILVGANTNYVSQRAFACKVLDNFNDSSVDTGIWTNTGATEDTEKLILNANGDNIISDGVSGLDLKSLSADSEFVFHWDANIVNLNTSAKCQISNGSTHIDVHDRSIGGSGNPPDRYQDTVRIKIDKSAEEAFVSVNGGAFGSAIDISSVTTNWYIRFITATTGSVSASIYFLGYVDGDGSTVDYVSADKTFGSTKTSSVLTWDFNGDDSNISGFISSNGGTNYSAATKNTWAAIGTTGAVGKIKLTITTPSVIDATSSTSDIGDIKMVGAYFDG